MATAYTINPVETARQICHELTLPRWWLAVDHAHSQLGHHLAFALISGCQQCLRLYKDPPLDKVLPRAHEIGPVKIPVALLNTPHILDLVYNAVNKELRQHPLTEVRCGNSSSELENYFIKRSLAIEQLQGVHINLTLTCYSGFKTELHDPVRLDQLFAPDALQRIKDAAAIPTVPPPASRRSLFP